MYLEILEVCLEHTLHKKIERESISGEAYKHESLREEGFFVLQLLMYLVKSKTNYRDRRSNFREIYTKISTILQGAAFSGNKDVPKPVLKVTETKINPCLFYNPETNK